MWHKQSFTQFWSQSDAYSRRSSLKLTYIHHPLVVCTHQICCAVAVPIALSQDRLLHGHNRLVNWTPCSRMREQAKNLRLLLLKYREYLQKFYSLDTWCLTEQTNVLRSDTTSNRINHTACQIWPTMLHISCALINSSTLKKYFNKLVGPRTFQNPSRNIIYTIGCSD